MRSQHPRVALARVCRIAALGSPWVARCAATTRQSRSAAGRRGAVAAGGARAPRVLLALGPTFIRFGQMLSIRPDVIPPEYELQKLCDVPSYLTAEALAPSRRTRPAGGGARRPRREPTPIAAASLGQAYRCRLRASGAEIALKVQRPDRSGQSRSTLGRSAVRHTARRGGRQTQLRAGRALSRPLRYMVELFKENILTGALGAADRSALDVKLLDTSRAPRTSTRLRARARERGRMTTQLLPRSGRVRVPRTHARRRAQGARRRADRGQQLRGRRPR